MGGNRIVIAPQPSDRTAVVGMTGSGKSRFSGRLLSAYQNVIAIDVKGEASDKGAKAFWPDGGDVPVFTRWRELRNWGAGKAIYSPVEAELDPDFLDATVFKWVYDRRNTKLWVGEVYAVCPDGKIRPNYKAVLTRGRSRGIGCLSESQRAHWIPLFILSESEHQVSFRLQLLEDRKRMAGVMGPEVEELPPGEHGFWYHRAGELHSHLIPHGIQI